VEGDRLPCRTHLEQTHMRAHSNSHLPPYSQRKVLRSGTRSSQHKVVQLGKPPGFFFSLYSPGADAHAGPFELVERGDVGQLRRHLTDRRVVRLDRALTKIDNR
jgi:hypothetical protein